MGFIRDSLDFLNKCPKDADEDTEIVMLARTQMFLTNLALKL